jgi:hypothetical protein
VASEAPHAPVSQSLKGTTMASEFNAIDYAKELQSAGVPEKQAAIHASALTKVLGGFALGRELEALRVELLAQLTELRAQFEAFKVEINARFISLETTLRADIKILRSEVKLIRWIVGISVGLQIAVLLKLIYP